MESRNAFVSSSVADECSVIIGHASPAYLYGLEAIIDAIPGLHVTASARTRSELLTHCAAMRSGIVMVDAELGEAQIDSQVRDLMTAAPNIRVMLMLATPLPVNVRVAIETGALGVVAQHDDVQVLRTAMQALTLRRRFISPLAAEQLAIAFTSTPLTMRELGVLVRLSQGKCNKEIARDLAIAYGTVKSHLHAIMSKLDVSTRTEALVKASDLGILRL